MSKKIIFILILLILIGSNLVLISRNSQLSREHNKLLLFSKTEEEKDNIPSLDMLSTLEELLGGKNPIDIKKITTIDYKGEVLSISLQAGDMKEIEEMEKNLSEMVGQKSQETRLSIEKESVKAELIYGGVR